MNDIEKLRMLLPHWMAHNAEHAEEFRVWAGRARAAGEADTADHIIAAAEKMAAASADLTTAVEQLGGPLAAPGHPHEHAHASMP